ncbi:PorT family protein [Flavobacterium sp. GT3R68]|uniref:PorT family protein n=1 Tax=Flavobacterium sp. GT3R68 TaxID=2594437 RepID=UPI000F89D02C|nr:PorT family protein [Flavobacterium sp. GT3R68]RTY95883.1 PorT family protein [Flavobacterium sp. GSN2]TRW93655.1 PorT family protein [Flavobacterium sp. GT3R68]
MKKIFLTLLLVFSTLVMNAQDKYKDSNRIGIIFGANQFQLNSTNFNTKPGMGWNAGLSMRGNFYNDWDMVYAMQFSESNFTVATRNMFLANEDVNYKLAAAQVSLMLSYKVVENHLSLEFGPVIQVNGKLAIDKEEENNIINGTTLMAKDITDISKFNFYPAVGITAGVRHLRLNVQYQYGVNNLLGNLNKQSFGPDFKGNAGILSGNIIVYL